MYSNIKYGEFFFGEYFLKWAILTLQNEVVSETNNKILGKIERQLCSFHSVDKVIETPENADYASYFPLEFLNSIKIDSLSLSDFKLKKNIPLILLCNLDLAKDLWSL